MSMTASRCILTLSGLFLKRLLNSKRHLNANVQSIPMDKAQTKTSCNNSFSHFHTKLWIWNCCTIHPFVCLFMTTLTSPWICSFRKYYSLGNDSFSMSIFGCLTLLRRRLSMSKVTISSLSQRTICWYLQFRTISQRFPSQPHSFLGTSTQYHNSRHATKIYQLFSFTKI